MKYGLRNHNKNKIEPTTVAAGDNTNPMSAVTACLCEAAKFETSCQLSGDGSHFSSAGFRHIVVIEKHAVYCIMAAFLLAFIMP